ncbi:unnamed protein product [Pedinophyceae sp. YPF-701]|nr:unnamed protein product [Pedinophyceae sp. YPF-701]
MGCSNSKEGPGARQISGVDDSHPDGSLVVGVGHKPNHQALDKLTNHDKKLADTMGMETFGAEPEDKDPLSNLMDKQAEITPVTMATPPRAGAGAAGKKVTGIVKSSLGTKEQGLDHRFDKDAQQATLRSGHKPPAKTPSRGPNRLPSLTKVASEANSNSKGAEENGPALVLSKSPQPAMRMPSSKNPGAPAAYASTTGAVHNFTSPTPKSESNFATAKSLRPTKGGSGVSSNGLDDVDAFSPRSGANSAASPRPVNSVHGAAHGGSSPGGATPQKPVQHYSSIQAKSLVSDDPNDPWSALHQECAAPVQPDPEAAASRRSKPEQLEMDLEAAGPRRTADAKTQRGPRAGAGAGRSSRRKGGGWGEGELAKPGTLMGGDEKPQPLDLDGVESEDGDGGAVPTHAMPTAESTDRDLDMQSFDGDDFDISKAPRADGLSNDVAAKLALFEDGDEELE